MNIKKRFVLSIFWMVLGISLIGCSYTDLVDSFWSGMGTGVLVVGILQLIRNIKYQTNSDYQEAVDTAYKDERNRFLSGRAWAWAGYLFVLIAAFFIVFFHIADQKDLMMLTSAGLCLVISLYWISFFILRKKY